MESRKQIEKHLEKVTLGRKEVIQPLWGGYGSLDRYFVEGEAKSIIVKEIKIPNFEESDHPRGWNTKQSHFRKLHSYEVEWKWYANYAEQATSNFRMPHCLLAECEKKPELLVLEDLDAAGFPERKTSLNLTELKVCLRWLANFHAHYMGQEPEGLWDTGTYWHLATRPDEFEKMENGWLKDQAAEIDQKLSNAKFQTIVHGDAKVANFCFSVDMKKVAAVDFQYVGGGCGMKDVAYLMSSCLSAEDCERHESEILDFYFSELKQALNQNQKSVDFSALEQEWRALYLYAWADFVRFLEGWAPEHDKLNEYSEGMVERIYC
ncbi:MAG: DUF1679 domain-containing protein [Vicingaceae bacterium]